MGYEVKMYVGQICKIPFTEQLVINTKKVLGFSVNSVYSLFKEKEEPFVFADNEEDRVPIREHLKEGSFRILPEEHRYYFSVIGMIDLGRIGHNNVVSKAVEQSHSNSACPMVKLYAGGNSIVSDAYGNTLQAYSAKRMKEALEEENKEIGYWRYDLAIALLDIALQKDADIKVVNVGY